MESTKRKTNAIWLMFLMVVVFMAAGIITLFSEADVASADSSAATEMSVELNSKIYEFTDDNSTNAYGFADTKQVTAYSNGMSSLGKLTAVGESLTVGTYDGVQAVGVDSGVSLSFSYTQNVNTQDYSGKVWKLSSDSAKTITGYSVGTIGNGAVLVLRSTDGVQWSEIGAKMVGINNTTFTFIPDGADVAKGTYFKFLSVAEVYYTYVSGTHTEWVFWPFKKKTVTDYSNYYVNIGQASTVYVCQNNPDSVAYSSQGTADYSFEGDHDEEKLTEEEIDFLSKGKTLVDGSVSFSYIEVDNLGNDCLKVSYSYNGGKSALLTSFPHTFTAEGKYVFRIVTPLGKECIKTMYIVDDGEDLAYSQYFNDGIVDGSLRIYNPSKAVPVYMTGKEVTISPQSEYLPGVYGRVCYYKDDCALEADDPEVIHEFSGQTDKFTDKLTEEGYYIFELYSSDPTVSSGDIASYTFCLYIQNNRDYAPAVNYNLLTSTDRSSSFVRKVYAVALKTSGGGSFIYCFPYTSSGYDLAYSVAENIELLAVEDYGSYFYYKGQNTNTKVKYTSKTKLFEVIADFASENVSALYLEADTEYLTQAADESSLKDLTTQTRSSDVCVVVNEAIKQDLQATELYLNGFKFAQGADYESDVVMALDEDGNQYRIPYGTDVSAIFSKTTRLQITEANWHGNTVYEAIYYAPDDNRGEISINVSGKTIAMMSDRDGETLFGHNVVIEDGGDEYDSQSILAITNADGDRDVMLLSEASGYSFDNCTADYILTITNRFGDSYSINLSVEKYVEVLAPDTDKNNLTDGFDNIYKEDESISDVNVELPENEVPEPVNGNGCLHEPDSDDGGGDTTGQTEQEEMAWMNPNSDKQTMLSDTNNNDKSEIFIYLCIACGAVALVTAVIVVIRILRKRFY